MAPKPARRNIVTIACRCGAHAAVDVNNFGRLQVCRSCKSSYTVAWKRDPKSGALAPVVVAQARSRNVRGEKRPAPAAPRAPAAGTFQQVCSCGYRRDITPEEATRSDRCPGCGKAMVVQKAGAGAMIFGGELKKQTVAPVAPALSTRLAPRPSTPAAASSPALPEGALKMPCSCGERLIVRPEMEGHNVRCPACRRIMVLESCRDPQTSLKTLRPSKAPPSTQEPPQLLQRAAGGSSTTIPAITFAACLCGRDVDVTAKKEAVCPGCGRTLRMEKVRDPQTLVTMIRPVFAGKPAAHVKAAEDKPAPPRSAEPPKGDTAVVFEEMDESPEGADAFPAANVRRGQELICQCGEELEIGPEDAGRHVQCPTCDVLMEVEEVRDSQTGAPVLRARVIGKMDDGTWSLSDFK